MSTIEDEARAEAEKSITGNGMHVGTITDRLREAFVQGYLAASRREPSDTESGQRSGECEHDEHEACDGTTPGWPCECSCHEPSDTDERSIEEKYFETLAKIDPSQEMARVIARARRDLAKRRDTDEREWEDAGFHRQGQITEAVVEAAAITIFTSTDSEWAAEDWHSDWLTEETRNDS